MMNLMNDDMDDDEENSDVDFDGSISGKQFLIKMPGNQVSMYMNLAYNIRCFVRVM